MHLARCMGSATVFVFLVGSAVTGNEVRFRDLSVPVPNGYGVQSAGYVESLVHDEKDAHKAEFLAVLKSISSGPDDTQRFFDFEVGGIQNRWSARGSLTAHRERPPIRYAPSQLKAVDKPRQSSVPMGSALHVTTTGKSVLLATENVTPGDWTELDALSFWIYRPEGRRPPTTIEARIYGSNPRARFWHKLVIEHQGWQAYSIPLRWMRWGNYHVPAWDDIGRFGFYFRDAGDLWIDSITLEDTDKQRGATVRGADLAALAFPNRTTEAKYFDSNDLVLITASSDLDSDLLLRHASSTRRQVEADFPFLPVSRIPPKLVVLPTREDSRQFVQTFAAVLKSQTALPNSDGFTLLDVSTSYWDPTQGTLRPVFTHEYVHGLICHMLRFQNQGDWLHEGAATYYQLKAHPQDNFSDIVRQGIEDRNFSAPLQRLCNGKRIPMNRYWQAMTVIEFLLTDGTYRKKLPDVIAALQSNGSADLGPCITDVWNTTWEQFTDDWRDHCRARYEVDISKPK